MQLPTRHKGKKATAKKWRKLRDTNILLTSFKEEFAMYEAPEIVYEGDLEIQAGSPLGLPDVLDLEDFES